jgi:hypothetical protein
MDAKKAIYRQITGKDADPGESSTPAFGAISGFTSSACMSMLEDIHRGMTGKVA